MPLPGPGGLQTSLGLLRVPLADGDRDILSLAPKQPVTWRAGRRAQLLRRVFGEGQGGFGGEQGQAEETLRIPRALSGICVPPLTKCRGTEGPSPTMAGHNSNPSAHREPPLVGKGKYSPGAPIGMFLPVCWSRA